MNTFTKLSGGDWGVRIEGVAPAVGAKVRVSKRGGASKEVTITGIVSTVGGVTIATIANGAARKPARSYAGARRSYAAPRGRCEDAPCCGCGGICGAPPGYGAGYGWDH
jgi:hypothetical protein